MWQSLLADVPATAPLHQLLVDRLAMLTSQGPGGAPNPRAMVDMLAARLKADPNDALGWVRLMRAYTVLGETDKAKEALASARKAFADEQGCADGVHHGGEGAEARIAQLSCPRKAGIHLRRHA